MNPPFFPLTPKRPGDRVKLPKHPASADTEYWYGTIRRDGKGVEWDDNGPDFWNHSPDFHSLISV